MKATSNNGLGVNTAPLHTPIKFYKGKPVQDFSAWYSRVITRIPWYIEARGKKVLVNSERRDTGNEYDERRSRKEIADLVRQLRRNGYSYFTRYSRFESPLDLFKWVRENGYTYEKFTRIEENSGIMVFSGNLCEYSAAFSYVILDDEMAAEIKREMTPILINIQEEP